MIKKLQSVDLGWNEDETCGLVVSDHGDSFDFHLSVDNDGSCEVHVFECEMGVAIELARWILEQTDEKPVVTEAPAKPPVKEAPKKATSDEAERYRAALLELERRMLSGYFTTKDMARYARDVADQTGD